MLGKDSDPEELHWHCMKDNFYSIEPKFESGEAFLNHMRCFRGQTKSQLSSMRRLVEQVDRERYNDSCTAYARYSKLRLPTVLLEIVPCPEIGQNSGWLSRFGHQ